MFGLFYDVGRHLYKAQSRPYDNPSSRYHVDSEKYIVHDELGYSECDNPDMLWDNPDIYVWVSYAILEHTMTYFFEFSG